MNSGVHTYDYDWQGNRLSATSGATGAVYIPDGLNQYDDVGGVAPTYDLEGNLLEIPGRMVMVYDAKNQMTFCSNASWRVWNTYDHLGRRIVKETQYQNGNPSARHYLYDGWNLIAETIPSASPNHYLWGLDLSGSEQGAGGVGGLLGYLRGTIWFIPLYDGNGNVTGYVNADLGRAVINYEFDAFGKMTSGNPTGIFRFRFSSKYFDVETGLYYYGRRFYDPVWGRWINRDPIEEDGGLNLYAFCGNDGVNGLDLLGLTTVGEILDTCFSFSNTSPKLWIMPEDDPYTGIVRQWSYVKAFVNGAKQNLASAISLWKFRMTSPDWKPGMSFIPDPNGKFKRTVKSPLGTDPDTAMYNYAIYIITKHLHSNLNFIPVIQTEKLHTSAIGSFDIFATADEISECGATLNFWMFNDMSRDSFGKFAVMFDDMSKQSFGRFEVRYPKLPMASQIMWWNWKESVTFNKQSK